MTKRRKICTVHDSPEEFACRRICHTLLCETNGNFSTIVPDGAFQGDYARRILKALNMSPFIVSLELKFLEPSKLRYEIDVSRFLLARSEGHLCISMRCASQYDMYEAVEIPSLTFLAIDGEDRDGKFMKAIERIPSSIKWLTIPTLNEDMHTYLKWLMKRNGIHNMPRLTLKGNSWYYPSFKSIRQLASMSGLVTLDLSSVKLSSEQTDELSLALEYSDTLKEVYLGECLGQDIMFSAWGLERFHLGTKVQTQTLPFSATMNTLALTVSMTREDLHKELKLLESNRTLQRLRLIVDTLECNDSDYTVMSKVVASNNTLIKLEVVFQGTHYKSTPLPSNECVAELVNSVSGNTTLRKFSFGDRWFRGDMPEVPDNVDICQFNVMSSTQCGIGKKIFDRNSYFSAIRRFYKPRCPSDVWRDIALSKPLCQLGRACRTIYDSLCAGTGLPGETVSRVTYYLMCCERPMGREVSQESCADIISSIQYRCLNRLREKSLSDVMKMRCLDNTYARACQRLGIEAGEVSVSEKCMDFLSRRRSLLLYKAAFCHDSVLEQYRARATRIALWLRRTACGPKVYLKVVELGAWRTYDNFIEWIKHREGRLGHPSTGLYSICYEDSCTTKYSINDLGGSDISLEEAIPQHKVFLMYAPKAFQDENITRRVLTCLRQKHLTWRKYVKIVLFVETNVDPKAIDAVRVEMNL